MSLSAELGRRRSALQRLDVDDVDDRVDDRLGGVGQVLEQVLGPGTQRAIGEPADVGLELLADRRYRPRRRR